MMEPMSISNALPKSDVILAVAKLLNIDPYFVEKDWYITQIINTIAGTSHEDFKLIFSGGTALSKAHRLIRRFSEDIDFRVITPESAASRKSLSKFKHAVLESLRKSGFEIHEHQVRARDENRFFSVDLDYKTNFPPSIALRPHIQIEVAFQEVQLPPVDLPVSSFVAELTNQPPEVERIACLVPAENAADKLSALAWRIPDRIRGNQYDDPSIVRHIHDLAILKDIATAHADFHNLVVSSMRRDDKRPKNNPSFADLPMQEKFGKMFSILADDMEYPKEYERFVQGTSYAPEGSVLDFKAAVETVKQLVEASVS